MIEHEDPKTKNKDTKPSRKDVIQEYKDENITYKKGEYGLIIGESLQESLLGLNLFYSNKDKITLKEGSHIVYKEFNPASGRFDYSFDKLIFDNPRKLPFAYFIDNENTYVFIKDGDKIISSVKLEGYTSPKGGAIFGHSFIERDFANAISGNETIAPMEMNLNGNIKNSIVNQIEELVTTGTNSWSKNDLTVEQKMVLSKLAEHLKTDDLKAETSLDTEKAKFKSNNKNKENYLPK